MGIATYPAAGGGVTPKVQEFTSTGTFTAPANVSYVEIFLVGGGGGGGSAQRASSACGGGGGGGGTVVLWRKLPVTGGTSYTVTIGAGGAGSTGFASGAVGGDTTFGSLATAWGGGGGGSRNESGSTVASVRGTSGGGANPSSSSGGGGGGAAPLPPFTSSSTTAFGQITVNPFSAIGGVLTGGWGSNSDNLFTPGQYGIDGFGGGGHGAGDSTEANNWRRVSVSGGGTIGTFGGNPTANGTAGTANRGGGGGAGSCTSPSASVVGNGGNGGSGYALVVYWS